MDARSIQERMNREGARLRALLDTDASEAIKEARTLEIADAPPEVVPFMQAAIFIDAGKETGDYDAVAEGVRILRGLDRDDAGSKYNLANGLSALATKAELDSSGPEWLLETSADRREARALYHGVAEQASDPSLSGQALTNLAIMLVRPGRWFEAYETYVEALRADRANAIASSGAAKLVRYLAGRGIGVRSILLGLAARYGRLAQETLESARAHSGRRASQAVESMGAIEFEEWELDLSSMSAYERFVARERLVLSPTVEGLDPGLKRWDSLGIDRIQESLDTPHGVPPTIAMFNQLKADFLTARWLAFRAIEDPPNDSGSYWDTLDYAVYGIPSSLLMLSHRAAVDLLDRVAVAASEYFGWPGNSRSISFLNRWHEHDGRNLKQPLEWQQQVGAEIRDGNRAVAALAEMAEDIAEGGYLNPQRRLRHVSTHRFAVLHDLSLDGGRESRHVEHFELMEFRRRTMHALRLARSAILYLVEAIALREARLAEDGGPVGTLRIPTHHHIRCEDDDSPETCDDRESEDERP